MAFKIGAYVLNTKKGGGDAGCDLNKIGVWPGREVSEESQVGSLLAVTSELQSMAKAFPGKSKPMFFTWKPVGNEKMIFSSKFRRSLLHIRVHVMVKTEEAYPARWMLTFDDVKVTRIANTHKAQHVEFSFKQFYVEDLS